MQGFEVFIIFALAFAGGFLLRGAFPKREIVEVEKPCTRLHVEPTTGLPVLPDPCEKGHAFQSREHVGSVSPTHIQVLLRDLSQDDSDVDTILETLKPKFYVMDVCCRCGKKVTPPNEAEHRAAMEALMKSLRNPMLTREDGTPAIPSQSPPQS